MSNCTVGLLVWVVPEAQKMSPQCIDGNTSPLPISKIDLVAHLRQSVSPHLSSSSSSTLEG